ncbi:hypothetical protein JKP88DRAFT_163550 [Tribonema minus]|uniref:Phage tail collar domain-containing protein n=1 Tax=Tribonema minus TaxID=303371 RepID=A0A836CG45_9STRA|nr:hypothetical protein JKP88DRAFT_163550 [Tribonema minus]
MPTGTILQYAAGTAPAGFLACDGSTVSRTTYSTLFAVIGTTYNVGTPASTHFMLPDMRGRVPIMRDTTVTTFNALAKSGGATSVTLSVAQLPSHSHTVSDPTHAHTIYDPGHTHSTTGIGIYAASTGITLGNTGSGSAVSILPPYLVLYYIIKV